MVNLKASISDLLHLFFPHTCAGCGSDVLEGDQMLCLRCTAELPITNFANQVDNPVERIFYGRLGIRNAASAYFFTKNSIMQHLIFQLKYRGNKDIGIYMGKRLGGLLANSARFSSVDVLVPLPLNPRKERKRGYNQATEICKGMAAVWHKPVLENAVVRKVFTETQTHKGRISRWENMEGVFAVKDAAAITGRHILLVDDVVTTGATFEACGSEILKTAGSSLSLATLAYTI